MADAAVKIATIKDLLSLTGDHPAELIDGQLVPVETTTAHGKAQRAIARCVGGPFDDDDGHGGPGGWWILSETLIAFPPETYRPDLAGWRRERFPHPEASPPIVTVIPDWCCEVLSPSNPENDRVLKRRDYAQHGVKHYWIVDPEQRVLEALELEPVSGRWLECGAWDSTATEAHIAPFEAIPLDLSRLFFPRRKS